MTTAAATPLKPAVAPPRPNRMTLGSLIKGKRATPVRAVLFGVEGIGKSTFAANAPAPIFLGAEDGTAQLDAVRFPTPADWPDALDALRTLTADAHEFQTLAIDTLDWLEPLIWAHICKRDGMVNIEAYGFGKGYQVALDEWRIFLAAIERLRAAKPMHVVMLAHSFVKSFKNPEGDDYDRYEMKLNVKASGLLKEWADAVMFANYETYAVKDKAKRVRGVSTGARLLYTQRAAAYDAKNRYSLPESLPLSWQDFSAAVEAGKVSDVGAMKAEIERKAKALGGDLEKLIMETMAKAGDDAARLAQINNRANARMGEKEQAQS